MTMAPVTEEPVFESVNKINRFVGIKTKKHQKVLFLLSIYSRLKVIKKLIKWKTKFVIL